MTNTVPISGLTNGSTKLSDLYVAVDVTDTTQAATGTTKNYNFWQDYNFLFSSMAFKTYTVCYAATTAALTAAYANGAAGVGATLTNSGAQAVFSLDGVTPPLNSRILVKNQAAPAQNGIYTLTNVGSGATNWVLTRATDDDHAAVITNAGIVGVLFGTTNNNTVWQQLFTSPLTVGTGAITYSAFSNPLASAFTNGQTIIGSTGAQPVISTITAGSGIQIANAAGSITISATGSGAFAWTVVSGASQTMVANNGYIASNAGLVTLTLPATANIGDEIDVIGQGAGGWTIAQPVGVTIRFGTSSTTTGVGGSISSTKQRDTCFIICTTANTEWTVYAAIGNLTIV